VASGRRRHERGQRKSRSKHFSAAGCSSCQIADVIEETLNDMDVEEPGSVDAVWRLTAADGSLRRSASAGGLAPLDGGECMSTLTTLLAFLITLGC